MKYFLFYWHEYLIIHDQNLKAEAGFKFSSYVSDRCYVSNGGKIHFITHLLLKNEKMCLAKRHNSKVLILVNIIQMYCIHSCYFWTSTYSCISTQKYYDSHIHNYQETILNYHSTSYSLVYLNVTDDKINVYNMERSFWFLTANNLYNHYIRIRCILKGGWL